MDYEIASFLVSIFRIKFHLGGVRWKTSLTKKFLHKYNIVERLCFFYLFFTEPLFLSDFDFFTSFFPFDRFS